MLTVKKCTSACHERSNSIYEKDEVPYELFINEKNGHIFKSCIDCRDFDKIKQEKSKTKPKTKSKMERVENYRLLKVQHLELVEQKSKFLVCINDYHPTISLYSRDKVPIELFRKYPEYEDSPLLFSCEDCLRYSQRLRNDRKQQQKIYSEATKIMFCGTCQHRIEEQNKTFNMNGELSSLCLPCKIKSTIALQTGTDNRLKVKFEIIFHNECCCALCHYIFISENNQLIKIPTYIDNNVRFCIYQDKIYTSLDFIKIFKDHIPHGILEFDHLPEKEQRAKGLLGKNDVFIPKEKKISAYRGIEKMRLEVRKCSLLCGQCHLLETIRREKGVNTRPILEQTKLTHCNQLKKEGCVICHYKNDDLPRFFHFDHIDPLTKIADISTITGEKNYSYEDLIVEIEKCRLLCKYCHFFETQKQFSQGLINLPRADLIKLKQ